MPGAQYRKGGPRSFRRRTMPPPGHIPETVAPGWALTITSADFGGLGAVTETPPAGFGCASSDLDDGEVQATGQQVRFTLQGDSPSPYIVNTPSQEGVYPFSGMLRDSDRKDTPAGGTSWGRATVQQPSNPGPLWAPEQLAHLSCRGGDRFRWVQRRVHPVMDDDCPAGASRPFNNRAFFNTPTGRPPLGTEKCSITLSNNRSCSTTASTGW